MKCSYSLVLAILLLALAACSGGGASNTSNSGLTPLDFDVAVDPESGDVDVIGYAVEMTNPMYTKAAASVPAGEELVALLLFEPEIAPGAGFSGDFAVRTTDRSVSKAASAASGFVYRGIWDSRSEVWSALRTGIYGHGTGGSFVFDLDFLGIVMLTKPSGDQFLLAAFADLAQAQVDTQVNFWAIPLGGFQGPVTYAWDFGDGSTATGDRVSHVYPVLGEYNVTLTATDAAGNIAPVSSTPISIVANPVPLTEVDVVVTDNGDGSFRLSATVDGGTPPFEYAWDFDGDGEVDSTAGASPTFTPTVPGTYVFELVVTDQTGATATNNGVIDARQVTLTADPETGYAPQPVSFAVTVDGGNATDVVSVDFGDGNSGNPGEHVYAEPGVYVAKATVSRFVNGADVVMESNEVVITVQPRPAPRIDLVTPARAPAGTEIALAGGFFFLPEVGDEVLLNSLPMPVVSWEPNRIVVTVPQGARDGNIVVNKALGGLDSNPMPFDVAPGTPGEPGLGQL